MRRLVLGGLLLVAFVACTKSEVTRRLDSGQSTDTSHNEITQDIPTQSDESDVVQDASIAQGQITPQTSIGLSNERPRTRGLLMGGTSGNATTSGRFHLIQGLVP